MSYFVTLSMPNSTSDPHGNDTASATPRSMMSRTSGAEDWTLVPPSSVTKLAMVASAGRTFIPLMSSGTTIFFVREWNDDGEWTNARQNLTSFISFSAYFRYQASSPIEPPLALDIRNGSSPAPMIGKRPGCKPGLIEGTSAQPSRAMSYWSNAVHSL